uniref:Light-independent protochlorophyllide reductase subunit B n=1 Tax=Glaucocystis incrassata TaxID=1789788 RepID=A0A3G1IVC8_9EUKA|nr:light-independent protochlorophyllide reductase subunit B [Glaucocystis incrassata]ASQ39997.1 light-independent protochlorophyllide reductase subunit B [Glaucocystis incrassata]
MKLAYWMYAGPAHIGTLRIASSFKKVHAIMHAPLGDDYFNVMRSMLERERDFTPVTASVVDRHVLARGSQEKVVNNITRKDLEEKPDLIVLTPTCTSSILQEDLQNFVDRASLESQADVLLADVNHYRVNELQAADRTLEQIVSFYIEKALKKGDLVLQKTRIPSVNLIGIFTLGFHNQHDCRELKKLFLDLGITVNEIVPENASVTNLKNLPQAWINIVPYREVGLMTAEYLKNEFNMPYIDITPIGLIETTRFIRKIQEMVNQLGGNVNFESYIQQQTKAILETSQFIQPNKTNNRKNFTKKAIVFGGSTHASAITKVLVKEMGINVIWAGTYCKYDSAWFHEQVKSFCSSILITEDHAEVGNLIAKTEPDVIFGTQMERHVGKRLNIACGVISAPVHIQNFPLGYRPFVGYEGTKQINDLVYNALNLGHEVSLFEVFNDSSNNLTLKENISISWNSEALEELKKIPGFIRNKVKRTTETFAKERKIESITLDVLYASKESLIN